MNSHSIQIFTFERATAKEKMAPRNSPEWYKERADREERQERERLRAEQQERSRREQEELMRQIREEERRQRVQAASERFQREERENGSHWTRLN